MDYSKKAVTNTSLTMNLIKSLAACAFAALPLSAIAQLVIDDFSTKTNLGGSTPGLIEVQPEVVGLTSVVDNITGPGSGTLFDDFGPGTRTVDTDAFATPVIEATPNRSGVSINFAPANVFRVNNDAGIRSITTLTYDGFDDVDLTAFGDAFNFTLMFVDLSVAQAQIGDPIDTTITVENNGSFYSSTFNLLDITAEPTTFVIDFNSFSPSADFSAVDSISLTVDISTGDNEGRDLWMDTFVVVPEPRTYSLIAFLGILLIVAFKRRRR